MNGAAADETRKWVERIVVGLNLCPFARRVAEARLVRYVVTDAEGEGDLLDALAAELTFLAAADRTVVETTILIHPDALTRFPDYLDFLPEADRLVRRLGLRGVVQIAGFHPAYQFQGTEPDAVENYTNRSPYPMLHLLREASVAEAGASAAVSAAISRRNVETLLGLGLPATQARLDAAEPD